MNFAPVKGDTRCKYSFVDNDQPPNETADGMIQLKSISLLTKSNLDCRKSQIQQGQVYSSQGPPLQQMTSTNCDPCSVSIKSGPNEDMSDSVVTIDQNSGAKTFKASNCHTPTGVHFVTSTQKLTDLSATHLQSSVMSQNSEPINLPPSPSASTSSPASNHHYLYQIPRPQVSQPVNPNPNPFTSSNSHIVSVGPDAGSIVSASSSSNNGSNDVETTTNTTTGTLNRQLCCLWCHKMFTIAPDSDKRLARSYMSFIIGRFLGILSSIGLLIGLFVKFFSVNDSSVISIFAFVIIATSICVFTIAALLVIWATVYKSASARKQFLESTHPTSATVEPPFLKHLYKNHKVPHTPKEGTIKVNSADDTNHKST